MRATIPPEILQDDENGESDPQMQMQQMQQQMQQMQEQHQQLQEQAQQLAEENEQMNGVINGKMIEKEIKEMEAQLKKYDIDSKSEAANIKNQLDQSKLGLDAQQLELQRFEAEAQARLGMDSAGIQANGNDMMLQQMQQMQAALAQSTEQYGAMLAATLAEIAKPREMTIETDENGDIIGGVSAPLN
jgi:predicted RNase H-like nuclease (RuvC/YqgF family)